SWCARVFMGGRKMAAGMLERVEGSDRDTRAPVVACAGDLYVCTTCEHRDVSPRRPRDGYRSVTPRIVVDDVGAQTEFLRIVFGATGVVEPGRPVEVRLGDSL